MSMTVKAYLKRGENANAEIRRFVIDVSVSSSYEYLSKKVAQVFPSLGSPENFSLSWKDSEGDNITFSSDDELMEGLGQISDDIFRIYVKEKKKGRRDGPCHGASTEDGNPEDQAYHPGVICDGCESRIRGPRFKCITCPDYDLCKQCEAKGLHPEHSFVKFRKPQVGRSHHGGFFNRPGMFRQFGHPGWRRWWQWNQQQQQQGCGAGTSSQEQQDQSSQGTSSAGPQFPGGCPMGAGPFCPPPPPPGDHMPPPPPPHAFLRDIGQTVAQMLDPLGIDVDIDIEQQGNRTHCAGETNACGGRGKHGRRHGGKGHRGCRKTWAGNEQASSMDVGQEAEQGPAGDAKSQEKSGEAAGGSTPNMEQEAIQKQPGGTTEPMETTIRSDGAEPSQTPSAPPTSNQSPSGSDDADWTMLENAGGNPTPPSQNPQEAPAYQYQTALNQMTAMGFDNEGGWLTSLMEAKGGDIGRVLDAIKIGNNPSFSVNFK